MNNKHIYINIFPYIHIHIIPGGKDWLAQCQDKVTEWVMWRSGFPVGQHYKAGTRAHCHKSVPVRI